MLQVILGEHPRVATTVELTLFRRYASPWVETWEDEKRNSEEGRWHQGLPFVWDRPKLIAFLREFVSRVYESLQSSKPGASHVLDKHPSNALFTKLIREVLPEARFIHIIRDGRDVACSMMSAARKIGYGTKDVGASAEEWKRHVVGARQMAEFTGCYLEVRYEDLLREGAPAYAKVLDFCGLSYEPGWIEKTLEANTFEKMKEARRTGDPTVQAKQAHYRKGRSATWLEDFSATEAREFEEGAGALLRELGYETNPDWWRRSTAGSLLASASSAFKRLRGK